MSQSSKMKMASRIFFVQIVAVVSIIICLLVNNLSQAAPTLSASLPSASAAAALSDHQQAPASVDESKFELARLQLPAGQIGDLAELEPKQRHNLEPSSTGLLGNQKVKRDSSAVKSAAELDTQETGHYLPSAYPSATESEYGYDAGKNNYGKQASDWSLYDQGNHGLYDKYGDKAWKDQGHNDHSSHGKHDSYGNSYNSHGAGHGSGYYSRDRGYGYEKHYAYDKEVASKHHADSHNNYGSQHGLHDNYGNAASNSHLHQGHDKYGQASRYGNHGYGKRGSNLAANHDYAHHNNKAHYYAHSAPQSTYSSYGSHVPTYRSTYSDYTPQIGYPSSYPSYY